MSQILRAGVIGAGVFGGHHARQYASLPGVALTAVLDPHEERTDALAGSLGARGFDDLDAFLDAVDLLTIASPASSHAPIALAALARGRHVYVEKPLADRLEDAEKIVEAARAAGCVLACGHQERAVFRAMGLFDLPERPVRLEAIRRGLFTGRNADVTCVLDLMIHDIDLALALNPSRVRDVGERGSCGPDEARAELAFEDGMLAVLDASRAAARRERAMRIEFPSGRVDVDFLARTLTNTTPFAVNADFAAASGGRDPLGASIADFVGAVRGELAGPLVTGEEALRTLEVALRVDRVAASTTEDRL